MRISHSYGDVTIAGEGLQIFPYARHSWPLSSEASTPKTRDTHTYCQAFSSGDVITCFYDLGLSRLGFEHPTYHFRGQRSNPVRHRRG